MEFNLKFSNFSFFKLIIGLPFLFISLLSPIVAYIYILVLAVGKAHSLGAWIAIWKAGKFTWPYFFSLAIIVILVSWWGIKIAPLITLGFVGYALFAFHYLFDEFTLHQGKKNLVNTLSGFIPGLIIFLLLLKDFFHLNFTLAFLIGTALVFSSFEIFYSKEINWFTIQTKVLTIYILVASFFGSSSISILNVFLALHYLFWFIYPVYNLHKYKRAERDAFIMMLLIIVIMSIFVYSSKVWGISEVAEIALRTFYIASITHILTTAPFGYLIGLPKPKVYASV